ncbi:unnamed protein product [Orchesella dallaii]|uniref:MARVEL domain-containing protein n=1 Tax=Orchesella dallaii TaxID=48710 RepID=A0ABP1QSM5_9HEXA
MGKAVSQGLFRILSCLSIVFGVGVLAVSGTLLNQALRYQEIFGYAGYGVNGFGLGGGPFYGNGGGFGGGGFGGGLPGFGYGSVATEAYNIYYTSYRIVAVAAVGIVIGLVQILMSIMLCFTGERSVKGITATYICVSFVVLLALVAIFSLAIYYQAIYTLYHYHTEQLPDGYNYHFNPEGQAFCAVTGIDVCFLLASMIGAVILAKKFDSYDGHETWTVHRASPSAVSHGSERGYIKAGSRL